MPVNPGLSTTIYSGKPYYRITSLSFQTIDPADHVKVVNGQGAIRNKFGSRYNYPGVITIYLTKDLETCFAEKMFYFHREILRGIDISHHTGVLPPFEQQFVLWEVIFNQDITDVFDMSDPHAYSFFNIFPTMITNPSQDYEHLKYKRADIQSNGYKGLMAPSSRSRRGKSLIVLFEDQSKNVQSITPFQLEFRLITLGGAPFLNHASESLHFTVGEVRIYGAAMPSEAGSGIYQYWQRVGFNH